MTAFDSGVSDAIGVYGKIGSQPDFLRGNAGEFSQAGMDQWFQEAVEGLRTEGTAVPEVATAFMLAPAGASSGFIGAFARSADAAGRAFPLVIFAQVAGARLPETFPTLPRTHDQFVHAAANVASATDGLSGTDLVNGVQALTQSMGRAAAAPSFANESAQPLVAALGGSAAALGYALRTFGAACDQAAKTGPAAKTGVITVDAPAPTGAVRELWLEMARRRLNWRDGSPSFLWNDGPGGRLLLTLGQPSPAALAFLANPRHRASRFWPLRTDVTAAIDQAMKALTPEQVRLVQNPRVSLNELLSAFT